MNAAYWRITDNCNIKCGHCCFSCEPGGHTISSEDAEKVVEHFPLNLDYLTISGGEIFTVKPLLYDVLSSIKEKEFPKLEVILQTNGFWVKNPEQTYEEIKKLYDIIGFHKISFASKDRYHINQGIRPYKLVKGGNSPVGLAEKKLRKNNTPVEISLSGSNWVYPFGRGKSRPKKELTYQSYCAVISSLEKGRETEFIDPHGNVYLCCWQMPYSIGSAIETPFEELFESARKDAIIETLNMEGLQGVVNVFNVPVNLNLNNPCASCTEVFERLNKAEQRK